MTQIDHGFRRMLPAPLATTCFREFSAPGECGRCWQMIMVPPCMKARTAEVYTELAQKVFPEVVSFLREELLRISYTHIVLCCSHMNSFGR